MVESGFSLLRIWLNQDRDLGRSGGGCSCAGEVRVEATDHAEVVLVLEKWRLFSAFHQFQQLSESPKISYWRINSFAKFEFSLNLHIYDEFSLNMHIYAGFYYVALAL
jgi:hypothetical protein